MGFDTTLAQAAWHPLLEIANVWQEPGGEAVRWSLDGRDMEDADTFTDLAGGGYHANSAINPPTFTANRSGLANGAMVFNGTTDRLEADAALAAVASASAGCIAGWIKPDDGQPTDAQALFTFGDTDAQTVIIIGVQQAGRLFGQCYVAGVVKWYFTTSVVFADGPRDWTHIALAHSGLIATAYANGVALAVGYLPGGDPTVWLSGCTGVDNLRIGCSNYLGAGDAQFFAGDMHDVRIYAAPLSPIQIARLSSASTWRLSDVDLALSDGTLYDGRIRAISPLRQDLGRLLEAQFVLPELTVELHNGDDAVRDLLDANDFLVGRAAVLKMGQGTTSTDYETKFTGEIRYPDGVQYDDEMASLTFTDALESDNAILPSTKIFPTTYPNAESKSSFLSIPEVLGDFRTTAGGGETVPGFCVDTTREAGTGFVARWTLRAADMEDADTFTDASGSGYHATSVAGAPAATTSHNGAASAAMDLNGTTDCLEADGLLAAVSGDLVGSVTMWVRPDDGQPTNAQALVTFGDTDLQTFISVGVNSMGVLYGQCYVAGAFKWSCTSAVAFADGPRAWAHIAIVHNGTELAAYLNGATLALSFAPFGDRTVWLSGCTGVDNVRFGCSNYLGGGDAQFFAGHLGDVRVYSTALSAAGVAATMTTGGRFTFGQVLTEIEAVYLNGAACNYTVNQLATPSLVTIHDTYASATDSVSANVYGRTSITSGTYAGYVDVPTAWAYNLLLQSWGMGLSGVTRIDVIAFGKSYQAYGAKDRCRRWIGSDIQVATLLAELCHDGFFELVLGDDGKYRPVARLAAAPSTMPMFRAVDIMPTGRGRAIRTTSDPERTYANQIAYDYRHQPPAWNGETLQQTREFGAGGVVDDTGEQTLTGRTTRRRIQCLWLYNDGEGLAKRHLYVFGTRLEMVDLRLGPRGLTLEKGDTFQLIYGKYGGSEILGTPFMVRSIAPDYGAVTAEVAAWNIDDLAPRRYQADGAVAWAAATTYDHATLGYYGAFVGDDEQRFM